MTPRPFDHPNFSAEDESLLTSITEGKRSEAPPEAAKAQRCRCENPWTDYDPDLGRYCLKCGKGI